MAGEVWRGVWLLLAAVGAIFGVAGYLSARAADSSSRERRNERSGYAPLRHKWVLLGYGAFGAGSTGYMTFMVAYLKSDGQPGWHVSFFWTAIGLASMVAPFIWPRLLWGTRKAFAFSTLVAINGLGAFLPLYIQSFPGPIFSALLFGSTFFAAVAATSEFVGRHVDSTQHTAAIGTFTFAFGIGQMLGPFCIGLSTDASGLLYSGFLIGTLLIVVAATLPFLHRAA
jgi:predicted MFS family arabinose efflux permease